MRSCTGIDRSSVTIEAARAAFSLSLTKLSAAARAAGYAAVFIVPVPPVSARLVEHRPDAAWRWARNRRGW